MLDGGVILVDRRVVETARGGDLVLDRGQLGLQVEEVRGRFQVRIVFGEGEGARGASAASERLAFSRAPVSMSPQTVMKTVSPSMLT